MSNTFEIKKQVLKSPEQAFAELMGAAKDNQIVELPLELIDEIDNQPQHIHTDKIQRISESMKIVGQLDPVIVVPNPEDKDRYILLAGRHRCRACKELGLKKVKAIIKSEKDTDKQRLMLLCTNNDRNTDYAPSEIAYSFLEQKQLLEKLGSRSTASKIAADNNTNRKSVHKYIQLTKLIKPLMYRVDNEEITVGAGYEISFISEEQQKRLNIFLVNHPDCHINKETAQLIREAPNNLDEIFFNIDEAKEPEMPITPITDKKESDNKKCPSEGQSIVLSSEDLYIVGKIFYQIARSLYVFIIRNFASTDELITYAKANCNTRGGLQYISAKDSQQDKIKFTYCFSNNGVDLKINMPDGSKKEYCFKYKNIDSILRDYIRNHINHTEIFEILEGDKNEDN